jgi:tetratricopeptide (TPR) repeat protein
MIHVRPNARVLPTALALAAVLAAGSALALDATSAQRDVRLAPAELALERGDCLEAATLYVKASADSRDPRLAHRATDVAIDCEELPLASRAATRWVALDPENVEALRSAGMVALQTWRIDDGRRLFKSLLSKPDVEPERALAEILPQVNEGDDAAAGWRVFSQVLDPKTLSPPSLIALARLAVTASDYAAASRILDRLPPDAAKLAPVLRMRAELAVGADDGTLAMTAARQAAGADPDDYSFAPAETLVALGRLDEARQELTALLGQANLRGEAERRLGLLAIAMGDFSEAQRRFGERLGRNESPAEAVFYLAVVAERRGENDLALQGYQKLVEAGGGLLARSRAATLLIARGKRAEGLALLDQVIAADRSQDVPVTVTRAQLLAAAGLHREALQSIDAALKRYPGHPNLMYERAAQLERSGDTSGAVRAFDRLLELRLGDPGVQNALGYTLADHDRDLARADRLLAAALEARPDNAAYIDSLGWLRFRQRDYPGATKLLERAWRLSQDAEIAAHWGEVLWASGSRDEARTVWNRSLARSPDSKPLRAAIERLTGARAGETLPPK